MSHAPDLVIDLLGASHDRSGFDCGHDVLNRYLTTQATQDVRRNFAQTYVLVQHNRNVIGYYTLSASMIEHAHLPVAAREKLPRYPIPAALIGRLAVDKRYQRQGLARKLLGDALHRAVAMSKTIGIHAVVVDAKDVAVAAFYDKFGFIPLSDSSLHMYLPIKTVKAAL